MKKNTIIKLLELIDWCEEHEQVVEDLSTKGIELDELGRDLVKELKKFKSSKSDIVTISDNGSIHQYKREEAIRTYFNAMLCTEGSAQCRYSSIYSQLVMGYKFCTDED